MNLKIIGLAVSALILGFFAHIRSQTALAGESTIKNSRLKTQLTVPIFFVGDRRPKNLNFADWSPDQMIGAQNISFGTINVPITASNEIGDTAKRLDWSISPNSSERISVRIQLEKAVSIAMNYGAAGGKESPFTSEFFREEFINKFTTYLNKTESDRFILFVHGCCCSPEQSFHRAAELAIRSGLPVLMFDWATPGKYQAPLLPEMHTYRRSERVLEISQHNFHGLISALAETVKSDCILIGHSMGNRLICTDLLQRSSREVFFQQIHLVRPDLSLPAFILEEGRICKLARDVFIYVSEEDPELKKAEFLSAGVPRLGRPGKLLELATRLGMTFDWPPNRYYLDVTALNWKHRMPFDLISDVIQKGPRSSDRYTLTPWSEEHTRRQVLFVRPRETDTKTK
jgi:Uncharacterized protein conserved in bacteria